MPQQDNQTHIIMDVHPGSMILKEKILEGIKDAAGKSRTEVNFIHSPKQIDKKTQAKSAVVVGVKKSWIRETLHHLRNIGLKPVLAGAEKSDFGSDVSVAGFARKSLVEDLVKYFYYAGRRHLASLGNVSTDINDVERIRAFLNTSRNLGMTVDEKDVYTFDQGSKSSIQQFLLNVNQYDGVICVNDYVAIQLIRELNEIDIMVPESLFVAGSGDMFLGRCITPSLTTTTLDYYNIGIQSINISRMLDQDPSIDTISIMIPYKLICRASTGYEKPPSSKIIQPISEPMMVRKQEDPIYFLEKLEECLQRCDQIDYKIVDGILKGLSTDKLAEQIFVTQGTVQYRLKKLYEAVGVRSKKELIESVHPYLHNPKALINSSE